MFSYIHFEGDSCGFSNVSAILLTLVAFGAPRALLRNSTIMALHPAGLGPCIS